MRTVHVAFVYDSAMCPPDQQDPRKYGAGRCVGVFIDYAQARDAVERETELDLIANRAYSWRRYKDAEDPDCWFFSNQNKLHSTHYGYVQTVTMERRATIRSDRRKP